MNPSPIGLLLLWTVFGLFHGVIGTHLTDVKQQILHGLGYHDVAEYARFDIVWPQHTLPSRRKRSLPIFQPGNVFLGMNLFGRELATFLRPANLTSAHFTAMQWKSSAGRPTVNQGQQTGFECHYRGVAEWCGANGTCVEGRTAFSNCGDGGLRGFVKVNGDDVNIQPLPRYLMNSIRQAIGGHLATKLIPLTTWDDFHPLTIVQERQNVQFFPSTWNFVKTTGRVYSTAGKPTISSTKTELLAADIDFSEDELLLQVGVFVDQAMTKQLEKEYSTSEDQTNAVLTAFNAVQVLYDDPSFGPVRIKISIQEVIFDDSGKLASVSDGEAETYLTQFCTTGEDQLDIVGDWDVTVILTGIDIYGVLTDIVEDQAYAGLGLTSNKVYGVTGLSYTGGLCRPHRNCALSEFWKEMANVDTIAHEIGHILGMNHDGAGNTCSGTAGKIMSLSSSERRVGWSTCSTKSFTDFLRQGGGACLTHTSDDMT